MLDCEHLLHFRNEFNKFNNLYTRMSDSICHMTLKLLKTLILAGKRQDFVIFTRRCYVRLFITLQKSVNHSGLSILMHDVI